MKWWICGYSNCKQKFSSKQLYDQHVQIVHVARSGSKHRARAKGKGSASLLSFGEKRG